MNWGCAPTLGSEEHLVPSDLLVQSSGGSQATQGGKGGRVGATRGKGYGAAGSCGRLKAAREIGQGVIQSPHADISAWRVPAAQLLRFINKSLIPPAAAAAERKREAVRGGPAQGECAAVHEEGISLRCSPSSAPQLQPLVKDAEHLGMSVHPRS